MFETVNKAGVRSGKRLTEGVITSILVHVGLVIVIVAVSSSDSKSSQKKDIDYSKVTFKDAPPELPPTPPPPPTPDAPAAPPPPPPPPPPPAAAAVVPDQPKVPKKPKKPAPEAAPNTVVAAPVNPNPEPVGSVAGGQPGGIEGGKEGGVQGGKIGGVEGGVVGGTGTVMPTNAVLPFGSGMDRPKKISGRDPEYSREALAAGVDGMMIVRCVIELDGKLADCKVIKSLPYMENAVLSALATHRYTPVMFQGRPQRVNYTFNIKLVAKQ